MRFSLALRYLRLLIWYTEAHLSYLLGRILADTIQLLWVGLSLFIALLCFSAALLFALANSLGLPLALLLTGLLWVLIGIGSNFFLKPWLHKRFQTGRHLYRMTLARSGLRLLEKKLLSSSPPSPIWASLMPLLSRWLWKWLQTKLLQFFRKLLRL